MIDSKYRSPYQRVIINPLLKQPWINRHDPTLYTFCGLFFGLLIPFFLGIQSSVIAFICLALSGFFDTLDGSLARHLKKDSEEGTALDIASDRIVEFAIILGLFFFNPTGRGVHCMLMLGAILFCVTTFLTVGIFTPKDSEKSFHYSPGIIERAEAFFFFALMILFPNAFFGIATLFTLLVILTGILRLNQFYLKNSIPNTRKIKSSSE